MELLDQVTEAGVKLTRLDFGSAWRDVAITFTVWKAERDGVTGCGPSPESARARLAAALAART